MTISKPDLVKKNLVRVPRLFTFILVFVLEIYRIFRQKLRWLRLQRRARVIEVLAERGEVESKSPKLLIVLTHISSVEEAEDPEKGRSKIEKLENTIEGVLTSFSHCQLQMIINTMEGRHVTAYLPDYQQSLIQIEERVDCDPMFVGFKAQDEMINRIDEFDWFIAIEDDIVVRDSSFLDKIECFNKYSGEARAVLLPHRYEMLKGVKTYIDLTFSEDLSESFLRWNAASAIAIGDMKFCEFVNPHAGIYCLSKAQLKIWMESGRSWYNQVVMAGPLESAITGCLLECFLLYKPHPSNQHFLEVQHWDSKYSFALKASSN